MSRYGRERLNIWPRTRSSASGSQRHHQSHWPEDEDRWDDDDDEQVEGWEDYREIEARKEALSVYAAKQQINSGNVPKFTAAESPPDAVSWKKPEGPRGSQGIWRPGGGRKGLRELPMLTIADMSTSHRQAVHHTVEDGVALPPPVSKYGRQRTNKRNRVLVAPMYPECHICAAHGHPDVCDHLPITCGFLTWAYEVTVRGKPTSGICTSCLTLGLHRANSCPWNEPVGALKVENYLRPYWRHLGETYGIDLTRPGGVASWYITHALVTNHRTKPVINETGALYLELLCYLDEDHVPLAVGENSKTFVPPEWFGIMTQTSSTPWAKKTEKYVVPLWLTKLEGFEKWVEEVWMKRGNLSWNDIETDLTQTTRPTALIDVRVLPAHLRDRAHALNQQAAPGKRGGDNAASSADPKRARGDQASQSSQSAGSGFGNSHPAPKARPSPMAQGKKTPEVTLRPAASVGLTENVVSRGVGSLSSSSAALTPVQATSVAQSLRGGIPADFDCGLPAWLPMAPITPITDDHPVIKTVRKQGIKTVEHKLNNDDVFADFDPCCRGSNLLIRDNKDIGHKALMTMGRSHSRNGLGTSQVPLSGKPLVDRSLSVLRGWMNKRVLHNNWGKEKKRMGQETWTKCGYTSSASDGSLPSPRMVGSQDVEATTLADLFDWDNAVIISHSDMKAVLHVDEQEKPVLSTTDWVSVPYFVGARQPIPPSWQQAGYETAYHCTYWAVAYNIFANNRLLESDPDQGRGGTVYRGLTGLYTEAVPNVGYTAYQNLGGPAGMYFNLAVEIRRPRPMDGVNESQDGQGRNKLQQVSKEYHIVGLCYQVLDIGFDAVPAPSSGKDPIEKYGVSVADNWFTCYAGNQGGWHPSFEVHPLDAASADTGYWKNLLTQIDLQHQLPTGTAEGLSVGWDATISDKPFAFQGMNHEQMARIGNRIRMLREKQIDPRLAFSAEDVARMEGNFVCVPDYDDIIARIPPENMGAMLASVEAACHAGMDLRPAMRAGFPGNLSNFPTSTLLGIYVKMIQSMGKSNGPELLTQWLLETESVPMPNSQTVHYCFHDGCLDIRKPNGKTVFAHKEVIGIVVEGGSPSVTERSGWNNKRAIFNMGDVTLLGKNTRGVPDPMKSVLYSVVTMFLEHVMSKYATTTESGTAVQNTVVGKERRMATLCLSFADDMVDRHKRIIEYSAAEAHPLNEEIGNIMEFLNETFDEVVVLMVPTAETRGYAADAENWNRWADSINSTFQKHGATLVQNTMMQVGKTLDDSFIRLQGKTSTEYDDEVAAVHDFLSLSERLCAPLLRFPFAEKGVSQELDWPVGQQYDTLTPLTDFMLDERRNIAQHYQLQTQTDEGRKVFGHIPPRKVAESIFVANLAKSGMIDVYSAEEIKRNLEQTDTAPRGVWEGETGIVVAPRKTLISSGAFRGLYYTVYDPVFNNSVDVVSTLTVHKLASEVPVPFAVQGMLGWQIRPGLTLPHPGVTNVAMMLLRGMSMVNWNNTSPTVLANTEVNTMFSGSYQEGSITITPEGISLMNGVMRMMGGPVQGSFIGPPLESWFPEEEILQPNFVHRIGDDFGMNKDDPSGVFADESKIPQERLDVLQERANNSVVYLVRKLVCHLAGLDQPHQAGSYSAFAMARVCELFERGVRKIYSDPSIVDGKGVHPIYVLRSEASSADTPSVLSQCDRPNWGLSTLPESSRMRRPLSDITFALLFGDVTLPQNVATQWDLAYRGQMLTNARPYVEDLRERRDELLNELSFATIAMVPNGTVACQRCGVQSQFVCGKCHEGLCMTMHAVCRCGMDHRGYISLDRNFAALRLAQFRDPERHLSLLETDVMCASCGRPHELDTFMDYCSQCSSHLCRNCSLEHAATIHADKEVIKPLKEIAECYKGKKEHRYAFRPWKVQTVDHTLDYGDVLSIPVTSRSCSSGIMDEGGAIAKIPDKWGEAEAAGGGAYVTVTVIGLGFAGGYFVGHSCSEERVNASMKVPVGPDDSINETFAEMQNRFKDTPGLAMAQMLTVGRSNRGDNGKGGSCFPKESMIFKLGENLAEEFEREDFDMTVVVHPDTSITEYDDGAQKGENFSIGPKANSGFVVAVGNMALQDTLCKDDKHVRAEDYCVLIPMNPDDNLKPCLSRQENWNKAMRHIKEKTYNELGGVLDGPLCLNSGEAAYNGYCRACKMARNPSKPARNPASDMIPTEHDRWAQAARGNLDVDEETEADQIGEVEVAMNRYDKEQNSALGNVGPENVFQPSADSRLPLYGQISVGTAECQDKMQILMKIFQDQQAFIKSGIVEMFHDSWYADSGVADKCAQLRAQATIQTEQGRSFRIVHHKSMVRRERSVEHEGSVTVASPKFAMRAKQIVSAVLYMLRTDPSEIYRYCSMDKIRRDCFVSIVDITLAINCTHKHGLAEVGFNQSRSIQVDDLIDLIADGFFNDQQGGLEVMEDSVGFDGHDGIPLIKFNPASIKDIKQQKFTVEYGELKVPASGDVEIKPEEVKARYNYYVRAVAGHSSTMRIRLDPQSYNCVRVDGMIKYAFFPLTTAELACFCRDHFIPLPMKGKKRRTGLPYAPGTTMNPSHLEIFRSDVVAFAVVNTHFVWSRLEGGAALTNNGYVSVDTEIPLVAIASVFRRDYTEIIFQCPWMVETCKDYAQFITSSQAGLTPDEVNARWQIPNEVCVQCGGVFPVGFNCCPLCSFPTGTLHGSRLYYEKSGLTYEDILNPSVLDDEPVGIELTPVKMDGTFTDDMFKVRCYDRAEVSFLRRAQQCTFVVDEVVKALCDLRGRKSGCLEQAQGIINRIDGSGLRRCEPPRKTLRRAHRDLMRKHFDRYLRNLVNHPVLVSGIEMNQGEMSEWILQYYRTRNMRVRFALIHSPLVHRAIYLDNNRETNEHSRKFVEIKDHEAVRRQKLVGSDSLPQPRSFREARSSLPGADVDQLGWCDMSFANADDAIPRPLDAERQLIAPERYFSKMLVDPNAKLARALPVEVDLLDMSGLHHFAETTLGINCKMSRFFSGSYSFPKDETGKQFDEEFCKSAEEKYKDEYQDEALQSSSKVLGKSLVGSLNTQARHGFYTKVIQKTLARAGKRSDRPMRLACCGIANLPGVRHTATCHIAPNKVQEYPATLAEEARHDTARVGQRNILIYGNNPRARLLRPERKEHPEDMSEPCATTYSTPLEFIPTKKIPYLFLRGLSFEPFLLCSHAIQELADRSFPPGSIMNLAFDVFPFSRPGPRWTVENLHYKNWQGSRHMNKADGIEPHLTTVISLYEEKRVGPIGDGTSFRIQKTIAQTTSPGRAFNTSFFAPSRSDGNERVPTVEVWAMVFQKYKNKEGRVCGPIIVWYKIAESTLDTVGKEIQCCASNDDKVEKGLPIWKVPGTISAEPTGRFISYDYESTMQFYISPAWTSDEWALGAEPVDRNTLKSQTVQRVGVELYRTIYTHDQGCASAGEPHESVMADESFEVKMEVKEEAPDEENESGASLGSQEQHDTDIPMDANNATGGESHPIPDAETLKKDETAMEDTTRAMADIKLTTVKEESSGADVDDADMGVTASSTTPYVAESEADQDKEPSKEDTKDQTIIAEASSAEGAVHTDEQEVIPPQPQDEYVEQPSASDGRPSRNTQRSSSTEGGDTIGPPPLPRRCVWYYPQRDGISKKKVPCDGETHGHCVDCDLPYCRDHYLEARTQAGHACLHCEFSATRSSVATSVSAADTEECITMNEHPKVVRWVKPMHQRLPCCVCNRMTAIYGMCWHGVAGTEQLAPSLMCHDCVNTVPMCLMCDQLLNAQQ